MSKSLGFSNTYAIALTKKRAAELGIAKISDLKRHPELKLALTHEFLDRSDGWPALAKRYDLPQRDVVGVDHDLAYPQLLAGEIDAIDVYSTDAMIHRGDLAVLEDDLKFFPRYDAVWLYRQEAVDRYPQLLAAIRQLEGAISEPTMRKLNDLVESREQSESQAAADFLRTHLGVNAEAERTSWGRMVLTHVGEHLDLVRRSLLPAIVVGIALGIFCQRRRRVGGVVLAAVGLLQTIPSLALLVLLLPVVAALGYREHRRGFGHGGDRAVCLLLASHRAKHVHGARRHSSRDRRIGNGIRVGPALEVGRDRIADRAADHARRDSHGRRAKRRLCDPRRDHRRGRPRPADFARHSSQRRAVDLVRSDTRRLAGAAVAIRDRRLGMGRGAARAERRSIAVTSCETPSNAEPNRGVIASSVWVR